MKSTPTTEKRSPDARGRFGAYGGRYVPETLMAPLEELERAYAEARKDKKFQAEIADLLANFAGRPTPLQLAPQLTAHLRGPRIYLKREDLLHTGAHKINNCIGQGLLAVRMGKRRVIAETGAAGARMYRLHGDGRHGAAALERFSHAVARRRSRRRGFGQQNAQRRDQRSDARLDDECAHHALLAGISAGRASISNDGARLPPRDR